MDQVHRIEQELDSFPDTLRLYRQQLEHWFSSAADQVSHAADLPSLMGMERIIRFGDSSTAVSSSDDEFSSSVVQCPQGGLMQIESKFESVYDIPLGNGGLLFAATDWNQQGYTNYVLYKTKEFYSDGNFEGGVKLGYSAPGGAYEVALFGRNITNEKNLKGVIENYMASVFNEPRIVGISVSAKLR